MTFYSIRTTKYAKHGQSVEVYNTDHNPVYLCRIGEVCFPCHKDGLSEVRPEEEKKEVKPQLTLF